jgi:hypothetical protein
MLSMMEQLSPRQQISAIMSGILEFAEVKANKELKDKITGLFKRHPQQLIVMVRNMARAINVLYY